MFGYKNPAGAANNYYNQIPGAVGQYYQPYIDAGKDATTQLTGQYHDLLNNPGGKLNDIGKGYHESPGFKFQVQQALQGANHAAGAGGMFGSPQHEQQNMQLSNDIANQDYNKWLEQATGLYNQGLTGAQNQSQQGQTASKGLADTVSQTLAQQGQTAYSGQQNQNQQHNQLINQITQLLGYSFL